MEHKITLSYATFNGITLSYQRYNEVTEFVTNECKAKVFHRMILRLQHGYNGNEYGKCMFSAISVSGRFILHYKYKSI